MSTTSSRSRYARKLRPSPAMVVAMLALLVSLSGSAYAASKINGKNIKASTITGKQVKNSSLTGSDIKNKSITKSDLAASVGTIGPKGDKGDKGDQGIAGTARAYAQTSGITFVTDRTKGFISIRRPSTGVYCLKPDPATGIDPARTAAVATIEYGNSYNAWDGVVTVRGANDNDCNADEFDVITMDASQTKVNTVSFMLVAP